MTLPALTGTPKQVAWANNIRETIIGRIRWNKKGFHNFDRKAEAYIESLCRETSAAKWISWRHAFHNDTDVVLAVESFSGPMTER